MRTHRSRPVEIPVIAATVFFYGAKRNACPAGCASAKSEGALTIASLRPGDLALAFVSGSGGPLRKPSAGEAVAFMNGASND
jgi:hypothetical protein